MTVIADVPPPTNGMTTVSAAVRDLLLRAGALDDRTVVPGARFSGWPQAVGRHLRLGSRALGMGWRARRPGPPTTLYLPADAGLGLGRVVATLAVARAAGAPRILLHHHSYRYIDRRSRLMALAIRAGGERLEHIFLSPGMAERFARAYGPSRSHVIDNAFAVESDPGPPASVAEDEADPTVGLLSNLTREKGALDVLHIAAGAQRKAGRPLRVRLAGPAEPDLAAEITALGADLDLDLELAGPRYGADKAAFLRSLDVFVMPTSYPDEAQPLVIYEALAAGTAVVAYDRGSIAEQLEGTDGCVVAGREAAADAVVRLVSGPRGPEIRARRQEDLDRRRATSVAQAALVLGTGPG